ncbi:alpha/beta hydrolase [Tropicibacter sp. R15_0]|uniref:alpha/beta fold hydrolase n=1 Tax=Tropicibacter sp. R15_0 TaxID=2821101 RepID=UPI001ADD28FA|nr:alpha/beta hydrolase [Tropicibacter sp. R15_0]MBO9466408.1 alpha/beta hydrolase [Tropicibacter sp. R15_0]
MTWTTRPRSEFGALRAITAGQGPVVVLIHGVGLQADAWNAQIDALSDRFRIIAVDMPGHGQSPLGADDMVLQDFTDCVVAGFDGPALVVGHSMGAMIALDMAIRHPDLVQGVAALNAIFERDGAAARAVKARANSLDGAKVADPTGTLERWFGDAASAERNACDHWLRHADPKGYRSAYTVFAQENGPAAADLATLSCPALFMTGQDEPNSTPEMSEKMAALAPKGRAQIIEAAAHMMPMTHAAQVNTALAEFAQEVWS